MYKSSCISFGCNRPKKKKKKDIRIRLNILEMFLKKKNIGLVSNKQPVSELF